MLTRGAEKAIPLTYLYPEFASRSFPTHDAYVDHVLARLQEIHDLVRRNTHQAQLRQKLKHDRAIQVKVYKPGDLVWVFCRYVPQKGSPKLMRAGRGPHRIFHTLQDGRVYILDTGQKVHFERLKPHYNGPLEFAAIPLDTGDIAVVMDPEPERSVEPIDDDCSKPSYHSEQLLSEASDVSLRSRRRHWMDTRLRTRLRAGGTRQHYQQFDYSTSETDDETSDAMLPIPTHSPQLVQTQLLSTRILSTRNFPVYQLKAPQRISCFEKRPTITTSPHFEWCFNKTLYELQSETHENQPKPIHYTKMAYTLLHPKIQITKRQRLLQ